MLDARGYLKLAYEGDEIVATLFFDTNEVCTHGTKQHSEEMLRTKDIEVAVAYVREWHRESAQIVLDR